MTIFSLRIFLIAILILSIYIRRDFNFLVFVLLVASGMMSIKLYGEKIKEDLKKENAKKDYYLEDTKKIRNENDDLKIKIDELKGKINPLQKENNELKIKVDELGNKDPLKQLRNYNIYVEEIKRIVYGDGGDKNDSPVEDILSSIIIDIEKEFYPQAFLKYFEDKSLDKNRVYKVIRDAYHPNKYRNGDWRKNEDWANERIYDLDDMWKKINK